MLASVHKAFPWRNPRRKREYAESIQVSSMRLGEFDRCPEVRMSALTAIGFYGSGFHNRSPYDVPVLVDFFERRAAVEQDVTVLRALATYSGSFASDLYYDAGLQRRMNTISRRVSRFVPHEESSYFHN